MTGAELPDNLSGQMNTGAGVLADRAELVPLVQVRKPADRSCQRECFEIDLRATGNKVPDHAPF